MEAAGAGGGGSRVPLVLPMAEPSCARAGSAIVHTGTGWKVGGSGLTQLDYFLAVCSNRCPNETLFLSFSHLQKENGKTHLKVPVLVMIT